MSEGKNYTASFKTINTTSQTSNTKSPNLTMPPISNIKNIDKNSQYKSHGPLFENGEKIQQQSIHDFYNMYLHAIENIEELDISLLKRSFDDYLEFIDKDYIKNINKSFCDSFPYETEALCEPIKIKTHPDHVPELVNALNPEFYVLFRVIDLIWKNEAIKKKDILYLTPCRVFLLGSIIQRKFHESLHFR